MSERTTEVDAVVVGAGFAGLYALHRLRGLGLSVLVLERGDGVGGTWYWNRYPGARCDIESIDYAYSFSDELVREWAWSERYAAQPEILRYLEHVADRFDLRRDIRFASDVVAATWDEDDGRWTLRTAAGEQVVAPWCVMASGCLSVPRVPDLPGLDRFAGRVLRTAAWPPEDVDLGGLRVGVLGTGSTGIQLLTRIAGSAARVIAFQRTPNYSMPARNRPLSTEELAEHRRGHAERRRRAERSDAGVPIEPPRHAALSVSHAERHARYEAGWRRGGINALSSAFTDLFTDAEANATAAEFARERIRELVRDPAVAEALSPRQHIGTKRTCVDTGYYEIYDRDDVELVDLRRSPLEAVTPRGLRAGGVEHELDVLVLATGFDAMTGALRAIDISGAQGVALRDAWAEGPRTLLGVACAGFPNLFLVTGPGSPSVLSNMVVSIEQHVDWIADCIAFVIAAGHDRIEATTEAQERWTAHVGELADATLYPVANSWYVGANVPGKPRVFMPYVGGVGPYRERCDEVAAAGYAGFALGAREVSRA